MTRARSPAVSTSPASPRTVAASKRDLAGAVALFKQSCAATSEAAPFGCAGLALTYEKGLGVPVSRAKAIELYRKGCKGGADWFCKRLKQLGEKPCRKCATVVR